MTIFFRTHFTKTYLFKLEVMEKAKNTQRYEMYAKEISIASLLGFGIIFLLVFCIVLTCSLYRQKNDEKPVTEYHIETFGKYLHIKTKKNMKFRFFSTSLQEGNTQQRL